jgi:Flp pilus assembly protein protease CpaA
MIDLILIIKIVILLITTGVAAYTDYKTGYIYNWISFPLIIIGFLFLIFESFIFPVFGTYYFLKVLIITGIIYGIGYLFYYFGKLGGGDVKLFLGINLLIPYLNGQLFILWVLVISSLLSVLIVSINYLFILFKKIGFRKMIQLSRKRFLKIVLYLLMFLFFIYLLTTSITVLGLSKLYLLILLPLFLGMFSVVFEPEIKKHIYLKNKLLRKIEEGDVLCFDSLSEDIQKLLNMKDRQVIEEKDLLVIKNLKVKTLPIYDNLPRFGPYIFLGVLFSFVFLILL